MVNVKDAGWMDYPKFVLSALLLIFSTICTFYAIIEKKTRLHNSESTDILTCSYFAVSGT